MDEYIADKSDVDALYKLLNIGSKLQCFHKIKYYLS